MKASIRIGTRGSPLALYQAELVKARILQNFPLVAVEIVKIKTSGDMTRRRYATPLETKRVFTREIEDALTAGEIDLAVHSAKDMAVVLPPGLKVAAALEREDPRDCLVSRDGKKMAQLPLGARIGTSSLRRKMQLLRHHPEMTVVDLHGNIGTRIRKLEEGGFDAIVLAHAGLKRLGLVNHVSEIFSEEKFYPAPGQGIVLIESREDDSALDEFTAPLGHALTEQRLVCERAFLKRLEGGCQLPCGIRTRVEADKLQAAGILLAVEECLWAEAVFEGPCNEAKRVGKELAGLVLGNGGLAILEKIRASSGRKGTKHE